MRESKISEDTGERVRIAVDIGGTFTDGLAAMTPGGRIWVAKTLTTPRDPGEAVTTVMADLLKQIAAAPRMNGSNVTEVVHGTTLVTNTLIERKGARTGLVVTKGTRDVLDIGREWRYDLYDLNLKIPAAARGAGQAPRSRRAPRRARRSREAAHRRRARAPDG